MVEPMSFDRIGNLGNSSTMKARLQEEVFPCRVCTEHEGTRTWASSAPSRVTNEVPFSSRCTTKSIAEKSYRLSSTCGAPRNHINVPPVDAHVDDSYMYQLSLVVATATRVVSYEYIR